MTNHLGLYLHIPFCKSKCNYCDFYSSKQDGESINRYISALVSEIRKWGGQTARPINTVYIGGGTPSLLNEEQLNQVLKAVYSSFTVSDCAEITVEINPDDNIGAFLLYAKNCGVNRVSIGIQSANDNELKLLGRRHDFQSAKDAVETAKKLGFDNISVDIMLGLPNSNAESLQKSIDAVLALDVPHISAYILKVEEGTPFYCNKITLPNSDEVADQYLQLCKALEDKGYSHYEISNFAKEKYQSRHNNKYWTSEEYIGIGPSAHSFFEGKRFYYPKNTEKFISNRETIFDGLGGDEAEFIMLALRLKKGLVFSEYEAKFNKKINEKVKNKALFFAKAGLLTIDNNSISLTDEGMLVSNTIINELTDLQTGENNENL